MTAPQVQTAGTEWDEDFVHLCCICDENTSMCGVDLGDTDWNWDDDETICPLCELADEAGCARCGS